jgi:hypothetical protein
MLRIPIPGHRPSRALSLGALATASSLAIVTLLSACSTAAPARRDMPSHLVEGTPMYDVLPLDGIPSIDEPVFVDAATASAFMRDDEPVLGVVGVAGTPKAYSAWHLDAHEIVNDELDGRPIAATW